MGKQVVWIFWALNAILALFFIIVGGISFHNVKEFRDDLGDSRKFQQTDATDALRRSLLGSLAGIILVILVVIAYSIFTFFYLYIDWDVMTESSMYLIVQTTSLYTSIFMLMVAMTLHAAEFIVEGDVIETGRNLDDSEMAAYRTTFVLTYLFVGTNIIMFLVFMLNKSQVTVTVHKQEHELSQARQVNGGPTV